MKRHLSPRTLAILAAVAVAAYATGGWFLVVAPKRAEAAELGGRAEQKLTELVAAQAAARPGPKPVEITVADIFRLAEAMPGDVDMSGILLDLSRLAAESGIVFESIAPGPPAAAGAYARIPVTVVFAGTYYELADLLFRLRTLVSVRDGELDASGRLFAVRSVDMGEGADGFPQIRATLGLDAFAYGTAVAGAGGVEAPEEAPGDTPATTAPATATEAAP